MADSIKNPPKQVEFARIIKVRSLTPNGEHEFAEIPTLEEMTAMAEMLDAISIRKMRFTGVLSPLGEDGWMLAGNLGATVTQRCVITLEPVRVRIDIDVTRKFIPGLIDEDTEEEIEVPDDDEIEPLLAEIDLGQVAIESLALALPEYPKRDGASLEDTSFTAPEATPMTDEEVKPFAGLAALKQKLEDQS